MRYTSPFDELFFVFRDFDNIFRRTFADVAPALTESAPVLTPGAPGEKLPVQASLLPAQGRWGYTPAVESYVKDGKLIIRAEVPGADPSELNVTIMGDTLTLSGEKKTSREVDEANVFFSEMRHGRFERSFTLPEGVKSDQIKARFESGVLELSMPAPTHAEPRKVQIETAASAKNAKAA
jgi:HSP20 family protein